MTSTVQVQPFQYWFKVGFMMTKMAKTVTNSFSAVEHVLHVTYKWWIQYFGLWYQAISARWFLWSAEKIISSTLWRVLESLEFTPVERYQHLDVVSSLDTKSSLTLLSESAQAGWKRDQIKILYGCLQPCSIDKYLITEPAKSFIMNWIRNPASKILSLMWIVNVKVS